MLKKLETEMLSYGINYDDLAKLLKVEPKTISSKIVGDDEFTFIEICSIMELFPKQMTFDYLFEVQGDYEEVNVGFESDLNNTGTPKMLKIASEELAEVMKDF